MADMIYEDLDNIYPYIWLAILILNFNDFLLPAGTVLNLKLLCQWGSHELR